MNHKRLTGNPRAIFILLLLIFSYSLILPYTLFKPITLEQEVFTKDQMYPVLTLSLANSFYIPAKESNLIQINTLGFAPDLVSFNFQNQVQALQLNPSKFPARQNPVSITKVPPFLKNCLLRI